MNSRINAGFTQSNQSSLTIPISQYTHLKQQIRKVRYPTSAFSQAQRLQDKINSFKSQTIRQQLRKDLTSLNSYRRVRGDGNCFFRALAFCYISNVSLPSVHNCFDMLKQINLTCCYPESIPKQFRKFYDHKFLVNVLQTNWEKSYNQYLKQTANIQRKALIRLFDECPYLDFIIILYFRAICLKAFSKFHQQYSNFIVGGEQASIRTYSQQTQGISINLCSKILNVTIVVYQIRKQQVNCYNYDASKTRRDPPTICLLFNQSHYDILQYNDNILAEKSALRKKDTFYDEVSERLVQGSCIQCGNIGYINQVSRLCLRCHDSSLNSLQNFKKQKFVSGVCSQCKYKKDNISTTYGLCQGCIQILNQAEERRKMEALRAKFKNCSSCGRSSLIDQETLLCQSCLNQQKKELINLESTRKKVQQKQTQQQQQKHQLVPQQQQVQYQSSIKKAMIKTSQIKAKDQANGNNLSKLKDPNNSYDNFTCTICNRMFLASGIIDGKCRVCVKK